LARKEKHFMPFAAIYSCTARVDTRDICCVLLIQPAAANSVPMTKDMTTCKEVIVIGTVDTYKYSTCIYNSVMNKFLKQNRNRNYGVILSYRCQRHEGCFLH